jgi:hypothetical protein
MIGPTASDAGTPEAGTATVGDRCAAVVTEFCSQAISRCMVLGFTLKECIDADMPMCCTGSACSRTSTLPPGTINACKAAIDAEDCNGIANSQQPTECLSVLQKS